VTQPSQAELREILTTLEAIDHRKTYQRAYYFEPYEKQKQFFNLGNIKRERLLTAGNQQGKTEAGAFEAYVHLTGDYPSWWKGRRFANATKGWLVGKTSVVTRDTIQKKLCGEPGVDSLFGTGMIPKDSFVDKPSLARGVTNAYDSIHVRHKSGGISIARFKSYDQGREVFQGETLDWFWNDEECPIEIYMEELARITATNGIGFTTFTSMLGDTKLTERFLSDKGVDRDVVQMGIIDALHIPKEQHAALIAQYLPHQRIARIYGGIMRGEGLIFTTPEESLKEPPITQIPPFWVKIWGIDFGIGHPFAAALLLWDRDEDVIHVHTTIRMADALSIVHADSIKRIGADVPVAWPRDGTERDSHSGEPLASIYKKHGLAMLGEHATWSEGGLSTYAGVKEMDERMKTGRFKVANHLEEFFQEYRNYHYKDGKIVKIKDDILSAVRIGIMMKRHARSVALGGQRAKRNDPRLKFAVGSPLHPDGDINIFG
jgi:phage terminase large subunit-like protein